MSLCLKRLRLQNFCSYEDHTFDFTKDGVTPYPFVCLYGPNGSGKSTALEAISLLTTNYSGRTEERFQASLRKYVTNPDYDPVYTESTNADTEMMIEGLFEMDGRDYTVKLTQNGYIRNDFVPVPSSDLDEEERVAYMNTGPWRDNFLFYTQRISHLLTADSEISMGKFQLHRSQIEKFEQVVSEITRYPAECIVPQDAVGNSLLASFEGQYCTDFVIIKKNGERRIHYKRMSAGERKICKAFSQLLNLIHDLEHPKSGEPKLDGWPRILLIDNVEMHVYWDRHVSMVDCLKRLFPERQIFATTHSGTLIQRHLGGENDSENELYIDVEEITG